MCYFSVKNINNECGQLTHEQLSNICNLKLQNWLPLNILKRTIPLGVMDLSSET